MDNTRPPLRRVSPNGVAFIYRSTSLRSIETIGARCYSGLRGDVGRTSRNSLVFSVDVGVLSEDCRRLESERSLSHDI